MRSRSWYPHDTRIPTVPRWEDETPNHLKVRVIDDSDRELSAELLRFHKIDVPDREVISRRKLCRKGSGEPAR